MNSILLILLGVETAALVVAIILHRRARRAQRTRRVEGPNSSYKSPYVQELELRERWESIDLTHLHEVNREEVEKLLAKVRGAGVRALTAPERAFLERMAEADDRSRGVERKRRRGGPTPRHAPGTP